MPWNDRRGLPTRQEARPLGPAVLVALLALAASPKASAWKFEEHEALGKWAYLEACRQLEIDAGTSAEARRLVAFGCQELPSEGESRGLETASRPLLYSDLFGESCALAADHLKDPEEFESELAGRLIGDVSRFLSAAMTNREHFHPDSVRFWAAYHARAVELAKQANEAEGVARIVLFERALYHEAFAGHFLHDSFSAGHMGFGRAASSNAPSRLMHNRWNKKGRRVRSATDEWVTYGDGLLDLNSKAARKWRRTDEDGYSQYLEDWAPNESGAIGGLDRLRLAATRSIEEVLRAFAFGSLDSEAGFAVWDLLPLMAEDPERSGSFASLRQHWKPARGQFAIEVWGFYDGTSLGTDPNTGVFFGLSTDYPIPVAQLWGGRREFPLRLYFGLSRVDWDGEGSEVIGDLGYVLPLFFTQDGLLSHDMVLGAAGKLDSSNRNSFSHLSYRINLELERFHVRLQVGTGARGGLQNLGSDGDLYATLGLGWLFSVRGGGPPGRTGLTFTQPRGRRPEAPPPQE